MPDGLASAAAAPAAPAQAAVPSGAQIRARLQVVQARKLLELALPVLGSQSEEGRAVVKAINAISSILQGSGPAGLLDTEMQALRSQAQPTPAPTGMGGGQGQPMGGPSPMVMARMGGPTGGM